MRLQLLLTGVSSLAILTSASPISPPSSPDSPIAKRDVIDILGHMPNLVPVHAPTVVLGAAPSTNSIYQSLPTDPVTIASAVEKRDIFDYLTKMRDLVPTKAVILATDSTATTAFSTPVLVPTEVVTLVTVTSAST